MSITYRWIVLLSLIVGMGAAVLSHHIPFSGAVADDINTIRYEVLAAKNDIKRELAQYPDIEASITERLSQYPLYVNINKGSQTIYWNKVHLPLIHQLELMDSAKMSFVLDHGEKVSAIPDIYDEQRQIRSDLIAEWQLGHRLQLPKQYNLYDIDDIQYLEAVDRISHRTLSLWRYMLFLVLMTMLLYYMYEYISEMQGVRSIIIHASLSLSVLVLYQLLDVSTHFDPLVLHQQINTQSWLVPDLASLILLCLVGLFWSLHISRVLSQQTIEWKINKYTSAALLLGMGLVYFCHITSGIVQNPKIHLDIDNILHFDKYSFLVLILLLAYQLLLFNAVYCILSSLSTRYYGNMQKVVYYGVGLSLSLLSYIYLGTELPLWILATYLVTYLLMLDLFTEHRINSIIWLIWWMVIFSSFLAGLVFYNSLIKDIQSRNHFVQNLYQNPKDSDLKKVNDIHKAIVGSDIFKILSQLPFGKLERKDLSEYVNQVLPKDSFLIDKKISIECYDNNGTTLFTTYGVPRDQIDERIDRSFSVTQYIKYNPYQQEYYLVYHVNNDQHSGAPFLLVLMIADAIGLSTSPIEPYNYYVLSKGEVILQKDPVVGNMSLGKIQEIQSDTIIDGISYVTHHVNQQLRIVNYKQISAITKPISLFSYIFSLLGLMIIIIGFIHRRYEFLHGPLDAQLNSKDSLRTKIQLVIIVLIVFSFLIIGLMTGYYFNNLLQNNQSKVFREQIVSILNDTKSHLEEAADEESALLILDQSLKEISDIHHKELSLYDRQGKLVSFTSQQQHMIRLPMDYQEAQGETKDIFLGDSKHTIIPLQFNADKPYGYLTITFANEESSYSSILDFISTILNVYVFLFLLAGAIALAVANSITRPLSIIAGKLKEFKLGATNEPLSYENRDEIGQLVNEYNNLIVQVQDSAQIIAKTERDMAWREMAKQVAHEIKNPLTPMKLSVQYLDKMVKTNPDRAKDITQKVAHTLINQIDALTNIANEFSNYATMPKASNEKIILNEIVEAVHDLFRKRDDMDITLSEPIEDLKVFVDRNQLIRILNNLVKNAIQAIPDDRRGLIEISLNKKEGNAIISVADNGTGIPDQMKQKVFTPNFTTKNSGTGLGLAISANMIDSMNGRIYFETEENIGTTFYVEIPLMKLDQPTPNEDNRVSLDDDSP